MPGDSIAIIDSSTKSPISQRYRHQNNRSVPNRDNYPCTLCRDEKPRMGEPPKTPEFPMNNTRNYNNRAEQKRRIAPVELIQNRLHMTNATRKGCILPTKSLLKSASIRIYSSQNVHRTHIIGTRNVQARHFYSLNFANYSLQNEIRS